MKPGDWVQWYDQGWRFGELLEIKGQKARVKHPAKGVMRLGVEEIEVWTAEPKGVQDATEVDDTGNGGGNDVDDRGHERPRARTSHRGRMSH